MIDINFSEIRPLATARAINRAHALPFGSVLLVVFHAPSVREWPAFYARLGGVWKQVTRAEAVKSTFDVVALVDSKSRLTLNRELAKSLSSTPPDDSDPALF